MSVRVKRAYEPAEADDGRRVLVDRLAELLWRSR
jgi:uncharacterized protein YeaO (DUF488 family)